MSKSKTSSSKATGKGPAASGVDELQQYAIAEGEYHEAATAYTNFNMKVVVVPVGRMFLNGPSVAVGEHAYADGRGKVIAMHDVGANTSLVLPVMGYRISEAEFIQGVNDQRYSEADGLFTSD